MLVSEGDAHGAPEDMDYLRNREGELRLAFMRDGVLPSSPTDFAWVRRESLAYVGELGPGDRDPSRGASLPSGVKTFIEP